MPHRSPRGAALRPDHPPIMVDGVNVIQEVFFTSILFAH